jgi:xanthine dehydrogenase accessory factor
MTVLLRGGGDLASGVAMRLYRAGVRILITEISQPLAVRRLVSFSEAVFEGEFEVEGVTGMLINPDDGNLKDLLHHLHERQIIPLIVDPDLHILGTIDPAVVVDCRMRKVPPQDFDYGDRFFIGLGPGFTAGLNCNAAVETKRGHYLGRVYWSGGPEENTGEPDPVAGISWERVIRAPLAGILEPLKDIGERVRSGDVLARVAEVPVQAPFSGVLRGMLRPGILVAKGLKIGDLDPRGKPEYSRTVSDKSLAVGGGVLEAILSQRDVRGQLFE